MEIITVDSKVFKELTDKIERIAEYVIRKENNPEQSFERWLNNKEVADLLKISLRTLQRLRTDKQIKYSMLRGKCLYRFSDIEKALSERVISCNPQTLEDFRKNYLLKTSNH